MRYFDASGKEVTKEINELKTENELLKKLVKAETEKEKNVKYEVNSEEAEPFKVTRKRKISKNMV